VRQVAPELGARYVVLKGSVRRAGDRIRITAQLIDATTGTHRWAERNDRKLEDTFAVQDEVGQEDRGGACGAHGQGRDRARARQAARGVAGLQPLLAGRSQFRSLPFLVRRL